MHDDEFDEFEEYYDDIDAPDSPFAQETTARDITAIPTIRYYIKSYATSLGGNDKKACEAFKQYESQEKYRRLQNELTWMKEEKVSIRICDELIGKKRSGRYGSYERWAELMLLWLNQAKA